jgi:phosphatidate cytidylyltransferase
MSMNWPTFRTRALTALVFVTVMLGGLLWNTWSFFILFSIIHTGCWIEYHQLNTRILPTYASLHKFFTAGLVITGWALCFLLYQKGINNQLFDTAGMVLGVVGLLCLISGLLLSLKAGFKSILRAFTGFIYLSLSFALLLHLRSGAIWLPSSSDDAFGFTESIAGINGYYAPLVLIGSIWINDTMAYIVGSFIGKTPLSPISPKKTWEGTIGGIILAVLIAFLTGHFTSGITAGWQFATIAAIASVAGTFGDLLESKIKRLAGVKDSGTIMPGHGGFMDRFDSLLIATPFVWGYLWLVA